MELLQLPIIMLIIKADLKERQIHLYLFLLLAVSIITTAFIAESEMVLLTNLISSSILLLFMLTLAFVWFRVNKPELSFIDGMIGKGDILLLIVIGLQLTIFLWLMVFIASLLLALVAPMILKRLRHGGIPLAAAIGLVYCSILLAGINATNDQLLIFLSNLQ